jgi:hypothetical protein
MARLTTPINEREVPRAPSRRGRRRSAVAALLPVSPGQRGRGPRHHMALAILVGLPALLLGGSLGWFPGSGPSGGGIATAAADGPGESAPGEVGSPTPDPLARTMGDGAATRTFLERRQGDEGSRVGASVLDVVAGPHGFVAVGGLGRDHAAVAWTSPDGVAWESAPDSWVLDDAAMSVLAVGGPGFVAAGGWDRPVIRASRDGTDWRMTDDGALRPRRPATRTAIEAMTRLADGSLVAVGWDDRGASGSLAVWRSDDGIDWERLGTRGREGGPAYDVAAFGQGWVAVGERGVRVSRDGHTWRTYPAPTLLERVAARNDLIIAVSSQGDDVWGSADGVTWAAVDLPLPIGREPCCFVDVAASSDRVAVLGYMCDSGDDAGCSTAVWTSTAGAGWERTDVPLLDPVEVAAVAVREDVIVVVGNTFPGDPEAEVGVEVPVAVRLPAYPAADEARNVSTPEAWLRPPLLEPSTIEGVPAPVGVAAARLEDGRILLLGGETAYDSYEGATLTRRALLLDPGSGEIERPPRLSQAVAHASVTTGPDGRVYVVPWSRRPAPIQLYDPVTRRWRALKVRVGGAKGPGSAAWLADGRLLIVTARGSLQVFDPRDGDLRRVPFPGAPRWLRLVSTPAGLTLAITPSRAWRFDAAGGWTPGAPNEHLLENPEVEAVAIALPGGRVAVLVPGIRRIDPGLADPEDLGEPVTFALLDAYDPVADEWATEGALTGRWEGVDAVELVDGRLLLAGNGSVSIVDLPLSAVRERRTVGPAVPLSRALAVVAVAAHTAALGPGRGASGGAPRLVVGSR